jgi:hypothetical protein
MKIYKLPQLIEENPVGEYHLGFDDLKTNAVYLRYGRLGPKETDRRLSPTEGHEEIICVVKGRLLVKGRRCKFSIGEGEAFHLNGNDTLVVDNQNDLETIYIAAGGCSLDKEHLKEPIPQKAAEEPPADENLGKKPPGPEKP